VTSPENSESLSELKRELTKICEKIAKKYNLFDSEGRSRKSFIADVLMKNSCLRCSVKAFKQQCGSREDNVDALYREAHGLALHILLETLKNRLEQSGLKVVVEDEAQREYGRLDVIAKIGNKGILLQLQDLVIIIEIKVGFGVSLVQLLRYGIEYPNSVILVWRVRLRQFFTIDLVKHRRILLAMMLAAINRGEAILRGSYASCGHNSKGIQSRRLENPQQLLDELLSFIAEDAPLVADAILSLAEKRVGVQNG
jgi:hypothetical protein